MSDWIPEFVVECMVKKRGMDTEFNIWGMRIGITFYPYSIYSQVHIRIFDGDEVRPSFYGTIDMFFKYRIDPQWLHADEFLNSPVVTKEQFLARIRSMIYEVEVLHPNPLHAIKN